MPQENFMKLYMKNLASSVSIMVDANIASLSETLSSEWNDEDFFGRSEEIGIYVKRDQRLRSVCAYLCWV